MMSLMPHQESGAAFLAARGFAFLWDDMGTGKTITAIHAADRANARKILVVCPAVVRRHWEDEFLAWQRIERPVEAIDGFVAAPPGDGVTVVSHACMSDVAPDPRSKKRRRDSYSFANLMEGAPYDAIIVDESAEFRDINATRAKNLYMPGGLFSTARHVWALTGTPVVNSAADLWLPAFGPLGMPVSWWDWCNRYAEMKPDAYDGMKPVGVRDPAGLAEVLRPHALRRTLESLNIALPPLAIGEMRVSLPEDALRAAMAGLRDWTPQRVAYAMEQGDEPADAALATVRHALGVAKAPFVAARVASLMAAGEGPVVVFFQHTDVRRMLFEALHGAGYAVSWIDGKVTRAQLRAAKEWFQAGRIDVLLVQTQAGGMGLTLVRGHRAVVAELPWTAVALHQAVKRIHRIGQAVACTADVVRAENCWLDDVLAATVARKHRESEALLSRLVTNS